MIRLLAVIIIPCILWFVPAPAGLTPIAWHYFAIYMAAILGIILRPYSEAVVLLGVIAVGGIFLPIGDLLSGYASTTVWLVFSAFLISQAFVATGLGRRIAYFLMSRLGGSSLGLAYGAAITDLVLSPATPSNTARTGGIVYPIYRSVAAALGSDPGPTGRKFGSYMTVLLYQISMVTAGLFITACAPNVLTVSFAKSIMKTDVSWMLWMQAAIVPGLIILAVVPWLVYKIYPPEIKKIDGVKQIVEDGFKEIGPMSGKEKILIVLFGLAILGWATGSITKIDATVVALLFFVGCIVFKLISWEMVLDAKAAWGTFAWYGGIIGLSGVLAKSGFFTWLAKTIQTHVDLTSFNSVVVMAVLLLISLLVRYIFASMGAYVSAFIPVLFTLGMVAQVPPMPLIFLIGFSSCFGGLLTHYGGAVGPVLFGTGYVDQGTWWKIGTIVTVFNVVIYMTVGLAYWKLLGLW